MLTGSNLLNSEQSLSDYIYMLGRQARQAYSAMGEITSAQKTKALYILADQLRFDQKTILEENSKDMRLAASKKIGEQLLDRLELTPARFEAMVEGVLQIAELADPVGSISSIKARPSGIRIGKMRVPLGVIGMIYESRPNVTIDAAALNIKVSNAVILRGGSESFNTNMALNVTLKQALKSAGLPASLVQLVEHVNREAVGILVGMDEFVDLVIPRGSRDLIERVMQSSSVSVLKHLDGNCHVYVDSQADLEMAKRIVINAKTRRYGVCNALESLLVDESVAADFFAAGCADELMSQGVVLHLCPKAGEIISGELTRAATEHDWYTEYLGPHLSIKIVADIDEAIAHINKYGSHHTDAIVTKDITRADKFLRQVDSSSVMVNTSTAFADGFEYGLGAEIGISTDKFHARGPVGLEGLTSEKYIVLSDGEVRS